MDYNDLLRQQAAWAARAAQAYSRLLDIGQTDTGQAARVRRFIAATFNERYTFNLFDLRALDPEISDDILACMDALRWARADLYKLVPDGLERVQGIIFDWGMGPVLAVPPEA